MSITIDDMKMPKSCMVCPFEHNGDCYGGKPKRIMDIEDFEHYRHPCCPLIEAEPTKHGRWSEKHYCSNLTGYDYAVICSECEKSTYRQFAEPTPNYCPYCGARMDGGEND